MTSSRTERRAKTPLAQDLSGEISWYLTLLACPGAARVQLNYYKCCDDDPDRQLPDNGEPCTVTNAPTEPFINFNADTVTHPSRRIYVAIACLALSACNTLPDTQADSVARLEDSLAQFEARFDSLDTLAENQKSSMDAIRAEISAISEEIKEQSVSVAATPRAEPVEASRASREPQEDKLVVGSFERIWVEALQIALPARIDTGAETASLDARNITSFERDGKPWVRFEIPDPASEEPLVLERRRVREALVVQANSDVPERRPVIELGIQLGNIRQLAEFTLSNRSHLDFQMLVGRNILRDVMLVDVSATNLVPLPTVQPQSEPAADATEQSDEEAGEASGTGRANDDDFAAPP